MFSYFTTNHHICFFEERKNSKLIVRLVTVFSLLISVIFIRSGIASKTPSNEDIAKKLLVETALQIVYSYASEYSKLIFQTEEANSEILSWMQQNLMDSCIAKNYEVYLKVDDSLDWCLIIDIAQPDITFEYESIGNKWLFFSKGYRRVAKSNFHLSVSEKGEKVLFSQDLSKSFEDTLKSIKQIENDKLPFTKGEKISSPIARRLIEPVLITASTITVVYLFYSLRSGK